MTTQPHHLDPGPTAEERAAFDKARRSRDPRFDGRFFVGVHTTGIYCRPICPARTAAAKNVSYYPSAAAAAGAGLRPCLRCRPEAAPGTPAWQGTATTVRRALRLIDDGALDAADVDALAGRLGVGERHLRRLFDQHLGASPIRVATTRRLHFARRLLRETELRVADVAFAAGFGSVRRFNDAFRRAYGSTPTSLRRSGARAVGQGISLRLAYRPPFHFESLLRYLAPRAIAGVEEVSDGVYRRTLRFGECGAALAAASDAPAWLEVRQARDDALLVTLHGCAPGQILPVVRSVRGLFDLDADPREIARSLGADPILAPLLDRFPGIRAPGAVDPFETAVRVVLGQQVTVRGASTLTQRLVELAGQDDAVIEGTTLRRRFPGPTEMLTADLSELGVPGARIRALQALARAVEGGELDLSGVLPPEAVITQVQRVRGLGPWTAQVIALRCLREPDVFPETDLGLRQALARHGVEASGGDLPTAVQVREAAAAWSPWRSYAAMLLWAELASGDAAAED